MAKAPANNAAQRVRKKVRKNVVRVICTDPRHKQRQG